MVRFPPWEATKSYNAAVRPWRQVGLLKRTLDDSETTGDSEAASSIDVVALWAAFLTNLLINDQKNWRICQYVANISRYTILSYNLHIYYCSTSTTLHVCSRSSRASFEEVHFLCLAHNEANLQNPADLKRIPIFGSICKWNIAKCPPLAAEWQGTLPNSHVKWIQLLPETLHHLKRLNRLYDSFCLQALLTAQGIGVDSAENADLPFLGQQMKRKRWRWKVAPNRLQVFQC